MSDKITDSAIGSEYEGNPCIAFEFENVEDAIEHMKYEKVKDYGDQCGSNFLHTWDDGKRFLCRCKNCGGFILVQNSEFHGFSSNDSYYTDWFPVNGDSEAQRLNEQYDGFEIENKFMQRFLMETNGIYAWRDNREAEDTVEKTEKGELNYVITDNQERHNENNDGHNRERRKQLFAKWWRCLWCNFFRGRRGGNAKCLFKNRSL